MNRGTRGWLRLLLLVGLWSVLGCDEPPDGDGDVEVDDDDDESDDDEGCYPLSLIEFGGALSVRLSEGDDDDSAELVVEGVVEGHYTLKYRVSPGEWGLFCDQRFGFEGRVKFASGVLDPGCSSCVGFIQLDPSTLMDITNSDEQIDDCSAYHLNLIGNRDFGPLLLSDQGVNGLTEMPLLDVETALALGFDPIDRDEDDQLAERRNALLEGGFELTHIGFVLYEDTIFGPEVFDLESAGGNAPDGSAGLGAFWTLHKDPETNPTAGPLLDGEYELGSFWRYSLERL